MVYSIYESNMERLEKKLNRIKNKCEKFGCEFSYQEVGEEFKKITTSDGEEIESRFVLIETSGHALLNNWEFIASIDHLADGNVINKCGTEIEVPKKYYTTECICEHCNSRRNRKNTYLVHNTETDEWKQVGGSCLNDFTHGLSADAVASYMSLYEEIIKGEAPMAGCRTTRYFEIKDILLYAFETVKKFGYVPSQECRPTKYRVMDYYNVENTGCYYMTDKVKKEIEKEMASVNFKANSEQNRKSVEDALSWLDKQDEWSDYMHNIKTICKKPFVEESHLGLLVSIVPTYEKAMGREVERKKREELAEMEKSSEFVGQEKERITINIESIKCVTSWETQWGITHIYKIVDKSGNVFTWKTSNWIDDEIVYKTITGTVKEHKEYRGIKQTELTRCKLVGA